ncbi:AAA family ATPase [Rhodopila globiformis]|uniref:AAA family ATPase n=1 Tax=Rhodopila globiformis TaxID=1071 RepID=UPI001304881E|nr:adenylate/guanylate cyclase domain-containing protein [Rhodopila globiformis]
MNCPRCNRQSPPDSLVCVACGFAFQSANSARQLRNVGDSINRSERRPATAVFCDLIDSVGLSVKLDPEDLMQTLERYHIVCDNIVADRGGFLAQFMGDGVLAYFGYPHAHEDDAATAVYAAFDILDAVRTMDADAEMPLQIRIGIATGLVTVRDRVSRANRRMAEITGRIPNLAARLQSVAQPGTIMISDETRRVTRGLFNYEDAGSLSLKGFTQPVRAWRVTGPDTAISRFHARLQGEPTPFVGRQPELGKLLRIWRRMLAGEGQVVQVIGDAGIGKSRLAECFDHELAGDPAPRIRWFGSPQHEDSPFHPVIEQFTRAARIGAKDPPPIAIEKLTRLLSHPQPPEPMTLAIFAALLSIPGAVTSPLDAMTPGKRKELTLAALVAELVRLSDAGPFILFVEDAHWIDASTLELLDLIVRNLPAQRCLVFVTARPEFKARWTSFRFVTTLGLDRLDAAGAGEICAHVAAGTLPPELVAQVIERSDGIPFYLEELTRSVVESREATGPASIDGAEPDVIPLSLHDSLVARLDRLGPARRIASIGAVIGRQFSYELLFAVAAWPEQMLRSALGVLKRSGVVRQAGNPPASTYLFRHALMRDAAHDSIIKSERQNLHGQVAATLEARFPEVRDSQPEVLAYHLSQTATPVAALPYWIAAGRRAAARAANREAIEHYNEALKLIDLLPDETTRLQQELSCLIPLALSLSARHGYAADEVRDVLMRARAICSWMGDTAPLFPVLHGLCKLWTVRGDAVAAEELARTCVRIGEQSGHIPYIVEADASLAFILRLTGQLGDELLFRIDRAVRLYEQNEAACSVVASEANAKTSALIVAPITRFLRGDDLGAETSAQALSAWVQSLNRPFDQAIASTFLASYAISRKDYGRAKHEAERAIQVSESCGFGTWLLSARAHLAIALGHLGQVRQARDLLLAALADWKKAGCSTLSGFFTSHLALFYAETDRHDEALRMADASIDLIIRYHDFAYLAGAHLVRARVLARARAPDRARVASELRMALSIARSQGAVPTEAEALAELAALSMPEAQMAD